MLVRCLAGAALLASITVVASASPEIAVAGNWVQILDGAVNTSAANSTSLGTIYIGNAESPDNAKSVSIQIFNLGDQPLLLADNNAVIFSGTDYADFDFHYSNGYIKNIPPGGISTFLLRCKPSADGTRNATCHISSNDSNEAEFNFAVSGIGVNFASPPIPNLGINAPLPPLVKVKNTNQGPVYKISGAFICANYQDTPSVDPFTVLVSLSFDTFADGADLPGKPKTIKSKLIQNAGGKLVKYKFKTTQNPTGGAIHALVDTEGTVAELNERDNRAGELIVLP